MIEGVTTAISSSTSATEYCSSTGRCGCTLPPSATTSPRRLPKPRNSASSPVQSSSHSEISTSMATRPA